MYLGRLVGAARSMEDAMGAARAAQPDLERGRRTGLDRGVKLIRQLGAWAGERARAMTFLAAVLVSVLVHALRPSSWPHTVRDVFARQLYFSGVHAVRFVALIAMLVGITLVVQVQLWLGKVGQGQLFGPLLVMVLVREVAPLLTSFVVIGRSGTAVASELASMQVAGEVRVLDSQGIEPFHYLVMPRVLAMALSIFSLTVLFVLVSLVCGFASGVLVGAPTGHPDVFVSNVFGALEPRDFGGLVAKTLIPGLLTGAICCSEGLRVGGSITDVPKATTRAVVRSVGALFITSAMISLLMYL